MIRTTTELARLSLVLFGVACVDAALIDAPPAPASSRSMLFVYACGLELSVRASALPAPSSAFVAPSCELEHRTWIAYLPLSLEDHGFDVGPLSTEACPVARRSCCVRRPLGGIGFDVLYGGGEVAISGELLTWPRELAALQLQSRCSCRELGDISLVELPGIERGRMAKIDETRLVFLSVDRGVTTGGQSSVRVVDLADLEVAQAELGPAELGTFPLHGFTVDRDPSGRIAVGTSTNIVLLGDLEGGLRPTPPLPSGRNSRIARLSPNAEQSPEIAALSEHHPTEFQIFRDGRWRPYGDPALMSGICRSGDSANGQRPEIVWLEDGELYVMPHSRDLDRDLATPTSTTHPHGLWHLQGEVLRWIRGPSPETDCMTALAFLPGHGLVAGTRDGALHRWNGEIWTEVELLPADGPPQWIGDVFELRPIRGGFVYGGREGYLSYVDGDVLCANFKPSFFHLRSMLMLGEELVISTDARLNMGDAQIVRIRLGP